MTNAFSNLLLAAKSSSYGHFRIQSGNRLSLSQEPLHHHQSWPILAKVERPGLVRRTRRAEQFRERA
ncbi:hypothetical protein NL676_023106 [Syzygium grande]|nr:hypothetical protein NL676_023106 [Syzygium grande]